MKDKTDGFHTQTVLLWLWNLGFVRNTCFSLEEYDMTNLGDLLRAAFEHNKTLHDAHVLVYDEHMNYGIDEDEELDDDGYFDEE